MDDHSLGLHGAFLRRDVVAALGRHHVARALATGEWRSPWRGVLVESARAADLMTLASAAVQFGGDGAIISGRTAAHLHGCTAAPPFPIDITVPYEHWLRSRTGLVVHNARYGDEDRDSVAELPVLCLEQTVADLLCSARQQDALAVADQCLAMVGPAQRERRRAAIGRRIARRTDPRGTRRGARLLDLATGRAESPAESWLLWWVVDAGYPLPEVNWSIVGMDGREVWRLDLGWPELRIAVEYDGYATHSGRQSADEERRADLRRRGWIVIVVVAADLRAMSRVDQELADAFGRRGVDLGRRSVGALRPRRHRERRAS